MATKRKKSKALPEWKIKDFSGGMVDRVDDNLLPDNAAKDCSNVLCKYIGILEKRKGQQRLNDTVLPGGKIHGLYSYYDDSPTLKKLLAVSGTSLYVWHDDRQIEEAHLYRHKGKPQRTEIRVWKLKEKQNEEII